MHDRVARLAAGLTTLGLKRGDRVAPIALNSDRYLELYLAVWWAGGVIVPGNTRWALPEHVFSLNDSGASILAVDKTFAELTGPIGRACGIRATLLMEDGPTPAGVIGFEELIQTTEPMIDACGRGDELAALFYTGGTTGRSKGVMLSHSSLMSNFLCSTATVPTRGDAIFLHSPPMFHLADAAMIIGITLVGGTHVIIPAFSPRGALTNAIAAEEGITELVLVPTMFSMLCDHIASHPADFSSVCKVVYGGSPISEAVLRRAMSVFPHAEFRQAYGQTELSPIATLLTPEFHTLSPDRQVLSAFSGSGDRWRRCEDRGRGDERSAARRSGRGHRPQSRRDAWVLEHAGADARDFGRWLVADWRCRSQWMKRDFSTWLTD